MKQNESTSDGLLLTLVQASAGVYKQYQISFWGQLLFGFLYSFGFFDSNIAGFILGFVMPVFWIILTYRFVLHKSQKNLKLPFPKWIKTNPGNTLVIVVDILFLGIIWYIILSGLYGPAWLKVFFTMVLPILTLSMLRNLVIYPFSYQEEEEEEDRDESSTN